MDLWTALLDVLVLLLTALLLGALCERLKQSAILGYLLAGTLLGPNALDWMPNHKAVATIAELGVALLLFTIGLEFSLRRLRRIGAIALGGGSLQVVLTAALAATACLLLGLDTRSALAVGAMIALSSTACVLRLLITRAEIDAIHGRNALGILLLQDIAVVPLVLVVTALGGEGPASPMHIARQLARSAGLAALLVAVLFIALNYILPLLMRTRDAARNRDLPILLAIVTAVGAAWASHQLGLSPALGAFIAGLVLAESPFATQIRADVAPLRTLFVTLFFSSIGMLANPAWIAQHWALVVVVVAAVIVGKAVVITAVAGLFRSTLPHAAATGICLAQVGEFSFVLAEVARQGGVITNDLFELQVAATIATLFLSPHLIALAPRAADTISRLRSGPPRRLYPSPGSTPASQPAPPPLSLVTEPTPAPAPALDSPSDAESQLTDHIVIVGFGPAGRRIAEALMRRHKSRLVVIELSTRSASIAQTYGLRTYIGDATRVEVLEHLRITAARAVAVTIPDPTAARRVIEQARALAPDTAIVARARYHVYRWELMVAGAPVVIDEEEHVGLHMAAAIRRLLAPARDA